MSVNCGNKRRELGKSLGGGRREMDEVEVVVVYLNGGSLRSFSRVQQVLKSVSKNKDIIMALQRQ